MFFSLSLYSQTNNHDGTKVVYEIDIEGFQKIILKKNRNNKYKGVLINHIYKLNFLSREITERHKIENKTAKKLINKIENIGINIIDKINCSSLLRENSSKESLGAFLKCQDSIINCLDGDGTYFKITINKSIKEFGFDCLGYNEEVKPYTSQNRKKAIEILKTIYNEINLKKSFDKFISNLKKGRYSYYGVSILEKR